MGLGLRCYRCAAPRKRRDKVCPHCKSCVTVNGPMTNSIMALGLYERKLSTDERDKLAAAAYGRGMNGITARRTERPRRNGGIS